MWASNYHADTCNPPTTQSQDVLDLTSCVSTQTSLEDIQYKLRIPQRKPWGPMMDDVNAAQAIFETRAKVLKAPPGCMHPEHQ